MPEACVEQVKHGVLGPAHVEVHRHPVLLLRRIPGGLVVLGIQVAEVVPARAGPLWHGVRLAPGRLAGLRVGGVHPLRDVRQGRLAGAGRLVALHLGQRDWELLFRQCHGRAILAEDDGERLAPVALAREKPVTQAIVDRPLAEPLGLQPLGNPLFRLRRLQAVQAHLVVRGVDADAVGGVGGLFHVAAGDHLYDGQPKLARELPVALVMRGHRHDRAGAVGDQDVVRDPDRDRLAVHRVDRVAAGKDAALLLR